VDTDVSEKIVPPSSGAKCIEEPSVVIRNISGNIIQNHWKGRWIPTFRRKMMPPSSGSKFVG
jgi:hypothetical protein